MDLLTFGNNLKYYRTQKDLTLEQMQVNTGFHKNTWQGYESGKSFPKFKDFIKISELLGVSEYDLLHTDLSKSNLIAKTQLPRKNTKPDYSTVKPKNHLLNESPTPYGNTSKQNQKQDEHLTIILTQKDIIISTLQSEIETLRSALRFAETTINILKENQHTPPKRKGN